MNKIIAIDLGGTKTDIAIFSAGAGADISSARALKSKRIETAKNSKEAEEKILLTIRELIKDSSSSPDEFLGIGVAAAGYWDKNYLLKQSFHLPEYIDYPIWDNISKALALPLSLATDVEAAAMGEAVYGLANKFDSVLYINLGTGLGAGLYKDGKIFSTSYSPTLRLEMMVEPEFEAAPKKVQAKAQLATTLINLACLLSPQVIAIGGGKANQENWGKLIQPAIDKAMDYLDDNLCYKIQIQRTKLENPSLNGAYELAKLTHKPRVSSS